MNPNIKVVEADKLPEGAVRIHLYDAKNVLMPRGSMQKESVGSYLLDRLKSSYEDWTDPKYGNNPSEEDIKTLLHQNLMREAENAWLSFIDSIE